jgi:hypothetical protein
VKGCLVRSITEKGRLTTTKSSLFNKHQKKNQNRRQYKPDPDLIKASKRKGIALREGSVVQRALPLMANLRKYKYAASNHHDLVELSKTNQLLANPFLQFSASLCRKQLWI